MAEGHIDIKGWIVFIVLAVVLLAVVAGTYQTLYNNASTFKNKTGNNSLATVLVTLLPVLLAAGILLVFVFSIMGKYRAG